MRETGATAVAEGLRDITSLTCLDLISAAPIARSPVADRSANEIGVEGARALALNLAMECPTAAVLVDNAVEADFCAFVISRLLSATWDKPCRLEFVWPLVSEHFRALERVPKHLASLVGESASNAQLFGILRGALWNEFLI